MEETVIYLSMVKKFIDLRQRFWDGRNSTMFRKHFKRLGSRWYEKNGLNGYVHDFSVEYDAIAVDDILDTHNYLMEWHSITKSLGLLKGSFLQD